MTPRDHLLPLTKTLETFQKLAREVAQAISRSTIPAETEQPPQKEAVC